MTVDRSHRALTDGVAVIGYFTTIVHDVARLREAYSGWDDMSKVKKAARGLAVEPERETTTENTTCVGLHEYMVDDLDRNQATDRDATHLAVGSDGGAVAVADTALGNEVFRTPVTTSTDGGATLTTTTFISSREANGNTLREGGLVTGGVGAPWVLLNHSTFADIVKDNTKTVTVQAELTFQSV